MYHKYHTPGFVLVNFNSGEASKIYKIFTRDLGLIYARAQSARAPHSKLKPALTDYSAGNFTFIKSKNGWKITDALSNLNLYFALQADDKFYFIARFFTLIQKLLPEDEQNQVFFDSIKNDINFLLLNPLSSEQLKNFECIAILRSLNFLGYLGDGGPWQVFLQKENLLPEDLKIFSSWRREAVKEINASFKASQLFS